MMSILVLLSVVLYVVASNHNMVLGMSRHAYLPLESTSSPSSFQSNASYCLTSTCVQQGMMNFALVRCSPGKVLAQKTNRSDEIAGN